VATGNVHHLDRHEKLYRKILISSQKGNPLNRQTLPDTYFRTTDEMLECFQFLGEEVAQEIVVANPNKINRMIDDVSPLKSDLFTHNNEGADEDVRQLTYKNARKIYGENLPDIVEERLENELASIIGQEYTVKYLISHKLVKKSTLNVYMIFTICSVCTSLDTMNMDTTEENPLSTHYIWEVFLYLGFISEGSDIRGFDLQDKHIPHCNQQVMKD